MEDEYKFDHGHCHAAIDRFKAKLDQCALELDEAANLLRPHYPAVSKLFTQAAKVAREH